MFFKKLILEYKVKHCDICEKCVQNFDHHCYYINNCVGAENLGRFFIFVILFTISLILQAILQFSIVFHTLKYHSNLNFFFLICKIRLFNSVKINYCIIMIHTIFLLFMIFSLLILLKNISQTIFTGKTYYERIKEIQNSENQEETIRLNIE